MKRPIHGLTMLATGLVAALLVPVAMSAPARAATGVVKVSAAPTRTVTYTEDGVEKTERLKVKVRFKGAFVKDKTVLKYSVQAAHLADDVVVTHLQIFSKNYERSLYYSQSKPGNHSGKLVDDRGGSLAYIVAQLKKAPKRYRVSVGVRSSNAPHWYAETLIGRIRKGASGSGAGGSGGSGASKSVKVKQVKTKTKREKASARFSRIRARITPARNDMLTRALLTLTDKETEVLEGNDLLCWLAGGRIARVGGVAVLTSAGRLTGQAAEEINTLIRTGQAHFPSTPPCDMLLLATLTWMHRLEKSAPRPTADRARTNGRTNKKPRCQTAAVGLRIDDAGRVSINDYTPPFGLTVACSFGKASKKGRPMVLKADSFYSSDSIRDSIGPKIRMSLGSRNKPKAKPKSAISIRQSKPVS